MHRLVGEGCLHIEVVDPAGQPITARARIIGNRDRTVDYRNRRQRDRPAGPLPVGLALAFLDETSDIPSVGIPREAHLRRGQRQMIDDNPAGDDLQDVVVDGDGLDGDDAFAGHIHGHVRETEVEEEVARHLPDAELAVQVLPRFADDRAANPVAEPRRLRDDQRDRQQRDCERPDPGSDVEDATDADHRIRTPGRC